MTLSGQNFIGNSKSSSGKTTFKAINPSNGKELPTDFREATVAEVDLAAKKAAPVFREVVFAWQRAFIGAGR